MKPSNCHHRHSGEGRNPVLSASSVPATSFAGPIRRFGHALALCAAWLVFAGTAAAELPRHVLEIEALTAPEAALDQIESALAAGPEPRERVLLQLARANACRVMANWSCQRDAGMEAAGSARALGDDVLLVRGLIAESRGRLALADYTRGERLLGEAQAVLERSPNPELEADVMLAFSSLAFSLGRPDGTAEYAQRGLDALGAELSPILRTRLLRNRARAEAQTGQHGKARATLAESLAIAETMEDPKLVAELALETARVARMASDVPAQVAAGQRVLELGARLQNSQLNGLAHEVLGLAAAQAGDAATAGRELELSRAAFASLGLERDELRLVRTQLERAQEVGADPGRWELLTRRFLDLDRRVTVADRAKAADDYDARLKYAQQELEVQRLANEADLARAREAALAESARLTMWLMVMAIALSVILAAIFLLQRRHNRELRRALDALRVSEARAHDLLRLSRGMVLLHDLDGRLAMVNLATAEALDLRPEALVGRPLAEFIDEASREAFSDYLRRLAGQQQDEGTVVVRRASGTRRHWRYSSRISEPGAYAICSAVDVTEQELEAERLRAQSLRDPLTGAWNRRYLRLFEEMRGDGPWTVVNVDLDHFKQINDTLGHDEGDRVLVAMTRALEAACGEGDAVVRSGGDEFLLLLACGDSARCRDLLARIDALAVDGPCRFSTGIAVREGRETLGDTMARADAEMYERRRKARGERRRTPA
jgi:diguanylate cyclase (GGDEF)-like protein/PAS domain S-box-containing protein